MNSTLAIRYAEVRDVAILSELAQKTYSDAFGHSFSKADLEAHLDKNLSSECVTRWIEEDVFLVAEVEKRIIGYVQFGATSAFSDQGSDQEIRRLYVDQEFQKRGCGGALMAAALQHPRMKNAVSIYLDVWEHNHAAQRFYRRYGFEVIGSRAFEVESGADTSCDLIMARHNIC